MYCKKCGKQIKDGASFCAECGASQKEESIIPINDAKHKPHNGSVDFEDAIKLFFINFTDFSGRASKSEFWYAWLFNLLVNIILMFIPIIGFLVSLGLLLPMISLSVRRLHDIGKSGWNYLLILVPFAGIALIVWACYDSEGDNKWGPGPIPTAPKVSVLSAAQQHEPFDLTTPEAKQLMTEALGKLIAGYTGVEDLRGLIYMSSPESIKENVDKADTDTLFVAYKALNHQISNGTDTAVLGTVQRQIYQTLESRLNS